MANARPGRRAKTSRRGTGIITSQRDSRRPPVAGSPRPRRPGHTGARARPRHASAGPIGLALAGGGPLGAIYEIGALLALSESLDGLDFNELDVYVGVSSGGFVAAGLANGISPAQMYRLFIDDGADAVMSPSLFLRPAHGEFARRAALIPGLLARAGYGLARHPFRHGLLESLAKMGSAVPTGIFDQRALDVFLTRLFEGAGRSNDFRQLRRLLFLVATDLDTGAAVAFGAPGLDHVPISMAVEASAALPGLFPPVAIDGRHYVDGALNKTLHASVALDRGTKLLFCINPLVPFDASSAARRGGTTIDQLSSGGLPLVLGQTFRAMIHSRMKVGMEKYQRQYPDADIVLFEPEREDADMFFANIFSYTHRKRLCEAAYRSTRRDLLQRQRVLVPLLDKHELGLNVARLGEQDRTIEHALTDPRPLMIETDGLRHVARNLAYTLNLLERWLVTPRVARTDT